MKAIADAKRNIEAELDSLNAKKKKIDAEIYKLNMVLETITKTKGLMRISRTVHTKKCVICGEDFKTKKSNSMYCSKPCLYKAHRKGVKLIAGAEK